MPPLKGFSDSPFQSKNDSVLAAISLLQPLTSYFSPGRARIRLPVATGAHFDEAAADLEGFARPLWAVGALLSSLNSSPTSSPDISDRIKQIAEPWVTGMRNGTDPEHSEYWGPIGHMDQRMVEAEIISYALLSAPGVFFHSQEERTRENIKSWLRGMNGKDMPDTNWRWFRVFANLALIRVCGVPVQEVAEEMESDFAILDSFYLQDGWSGDGPWLTTEQEEQQSMAYEQTGRRDQVGPGRQVDYYSGSFAIQFSQLLYTKFAQEIDPERVEKYRQQARDFGASIWRYFDSDGSAIPFGRSLTYRFACGGFFAALAVAKVPNMPFPLSEPGLVKGFLHRHLRWWAGNSTSIFHTDGTMNIGWLYPNMFMCEDYNSPQSPYWCMKTLIAVSLGESDDFWTVEEQPSPSSFKPTLIPAPKQIISNHPQGNHHFMLSPAQFVAWPMKASQAKYCKFEYSSNFPFSVPTGPLIQQLGPDCTLALSRDGAETWALKWKCSEPTFPRLTLKTNQGTQQIMAAAVRWFPWGDQEVEVETMLIPPTDRWPDWHVRVHRVRMHKSLRTLHSVEGGFASPLCSVKDGRKIQAISSLPVDAASGSTEGIVQDRNSVLILSAAGCSGISTTPFDASPWSSSTSRALQPDTNTSLAFPRSVIPILEGDSVGGLEAGSQIVFGASIFAIAKEKAGGRSLADRWVDKPRLSTSLTGSSTEDCIIICH